MADTGFQIDQHLGDDITVCIDTTTGTSPWIRWKTNNGDPVHEWKLMRITEHGNLWLPQEFVK
jgi:hypothetical protein